MACGPCSWTILSSLSFVLTVAFSIFVFRALKGFPQLYPGSVDSAGSQTSIILPVRNQESTLGDCVDSLMNLSPPPKEVIVVDGNSTDGTLAILNSRRPYITVLEEEKLPEGWIGKSWACHQGYLKSQGDTLLFTDGDTVHSPESLRIAENYLAAESLDMLSLTPYPVLESPWEKILMPTIFLYIMLFMGGKRVNLPTSDASMGNGQYILVRRKAYESVGGHERIRGDLVEDYRLAKNLKRAKLKVRVLHAPKLLKVRMYATFREIWDGWKKNFFGVSDCSMLKALKNIALVTVPVFQAFIFAGSLFLALKGHSVIAALLSFFAVGGLLLVFGSFYRSLGVGRYSLMSSIACGIYLLIAFDSIVRSKLHRSFQWKDREYFVKSPESSR